MDKATEELLRDIVADLRFKRMSRVDKDKIILRIIERLEE